MTPDGSWSGRALLPAALALAIGLGVVLVRPPIPVDETRYLEVLRESLAGNPLLLTLSGEPYAEKPPLLFWLARVLTWLALPRETALRVLPALCTALAVVFVARIGERAGLRLAGWLQALLLLPFLAGQYLLFDPLLALAVWAGLDAWILRRDALAGAWFAAALLAKGPVALLFLVPFLWSTAPLRATSGGDGKRAVLLLALALVPLAAWALAAAALGGPEFAHALLWKRWAGRIVSSDEHARPAWFYLAVLVVGGLPATLLLPWRAGGELPAWARRLLASLGFLLVAFTLIRGKQAHYLTPLAPALALLGARELEGSRGAGRRLLAGVRVLLGLFVALAVAGALWLPGLADRVGARGAELLARGGWRGPLALSAGAALAGLAATFALRRSHTALLAASLACLGTSALAAHRLAGELLHPHELAAVLTEERAAPLAFLGTSKHGLYRLLAERDDLETLAGPGELARWAALHPGGLVLADAAALGREIPAGLALAAHDVVHGYTVLVLRAGALASGAQ